MTGPAPAPTGKTAAGTRSGELAPARVRAVRDVAVDARMIELEPTDGARPYPTGSHLDVAVEIEGREDRRSYSLVGERPVDGAYRIAVKAVADSRGGSVWMHGLSAGDRVRISPPRSDFELHYGCSEYLLVAGGIGVTPMVGLATALVRHGRPFRMVYAGRSRDQMPFVDELSEVLGERLELRVSSEGTPLRLADEIDRLASGGELYLCGPARLRTEAIALWRDGSRAPETLRYETFASGGLLDAQPFVVRVRDRGDVEVPVPGHRSMLDALADHGIEVVSDCRRGECGLCRVAVLECDGRLDHRDVYLSDQERAAGADIITCVSRLAGGTVTIDSGFRAAHGRAG
jgi:ferredoxin-NADP reductase